MPKQKYPFTPPSKPVATIPTTGDNQTEDLASEKPTRKRLKQVLPIDGYTRVMAMANILGIHHITLRRWWKAGKFPKPLMLNGILLFSNAEVLDFAKKNMAKTA